jgi:peptidoglycan/LPS O-acetylase OafA/YrhL
MQIIEPVTMLTDYALAAASLIFAILLYRAMGPRNRVSAWLWCAGFVTAAVAAAVGGTYHGFALQFDDWTHRALWNVIVYAMGVSAGLMVAGCHTAYIRKEDGSMKWMLWGIAVTIIAAIVQRSGFRSHQDFNHNDAYHVIQIAGLYLFFKGASRLRDRPGITA